MSRGPFVTLRDSGLTQPHQTSQSFLTLTPTIHNAVALQNSKSAGGGATEQGGDQGQGGEAETAGINPSVVSIPGHADSLRRSVI